MVKPGKKTVHYEVPARRPQQQPRIEYNIWAIKHLNYQTKEINNGY